MAPPKDIVLTPAEADFACELDEGCSEIASNDKKFEMNFDFREFARTDIKITITKTEIQMRAFSETEFEENEFDEDISIPARVKRDTIQCTFNKQGVLRISAPLQPKESKAVPGKTVEERETTVTKKTTGSTSTTTIKSATSSEQVETEDANAKKAIKKQEDKETEKAIKNTKVGKLEKKPLQKDPEGNTIIPPPGKLNFKVDEKAIKDKPEFVPGSIKSKLEAYMKIAQYSPEEITVKVMKANNRILRVEGRRESKTEKKSFYKEIVLPEGVKPEEINVAMNDDGVLRVTIEPEIPEPEPEPEPVPEPPKKKEEAKPREKGVLMRPKKTDFKCTEEQIKTSMEKEVNFKQVNEKTVQTFVNVSQYTYEEVTIQRIKRTITIEAKHVQTKEEKEVGKIEIPPLFREVEVPEHVDVENISCELNPTGILKFEGNIFVRNMVKQLEEAKAAEAGGKKLLLKATIETDSIGVPAPTGAPAQMLSLGADGHYRTRVTAQGYLPEEVDITIKPGWIFIKGKKQARGAFADSAFRSRSFSKKIQIPPQIKNLESIVFELNVTTGALNISAPAAK